MALSWAFPPDADGDELDYTTLEDATGAQLAIALAREKKTWRHHSLSEIWQRFRTAGGRAEDKIGLILEL